MLSNSPTRKRNSIDESLHTILLGSVIKARQKDLELISNTNSAIADQPLKLFPFREQPSFRPSEIFQGLYLGGAKDVAQSVKKTVLYPRKKVRVYVCCCAVAADHTTASNDKRTEDFSCTSPVNEHLSPTREVSAFYRPSLVEVHRTFKASEEEADKLVSPRSSSGDLPRLVSVEKYKGDWWRNTDSEFNQMLDWINAKFLTPLRNETTEGDKYELVIRIPAQDEIEYSFSKAAAPYIPIVPKLLEYLLRVSEEGAVVHAPKLISNNEVRTDTEGQSPPVITCSRWYSIAVYCAAGKSRSVTLVAATLIRLLALRLVQYKDSTRSASPPTLTTTLPNPYNVFFGSLTGDVESVASIAVTVVLNYIKSRRTASGPNPGFCQQLIHYASSELERVL